MLGHFSFFFQRQFSTFQEIGSYEQAQRSQNGSRNGSTHWRTAPVTPPVETTHAKADPTQKPKPEQCIQSRSAFVPPKCVFPPPARHSAETSRHAAEGTTGALLRRQPWMSGGNNLFIGDE
jgi:hypothetical protein